MQGKFLLPQKSVNLFFTFVIDSTLYQAEDRPRADHPIWQHADKCHPSWTKTYGGSCLVEQCNVIFFVIILYFLAPLSVICLLSLFSPYLQDMVTKHYGISGWEQNLISIEHFFLVKVFKFCDMQRLLKTMAAYIVMLKCETFHEVKYILWMLVEI